MKYIAKIIVVLFLANVTFTLSSLRFNDMNVLSAKPEDSDSLKSIII